VIGAGMPEAALRASPQRSEDLARRAAIGYALQLGIRSKDKETKYWRTALGIKQCGCRQSPLTKLLL